MTATYSLTLPAAKVVVLNARDADDARELLAMLGLVHEGAIVPDDLRRYDTEAASPNKLVTPTALRLVQS